MSRRIDDDVLHHSLLEAKLDGLAPVICRVAEAVILRNWPIRRHQPVAAGHTLPADRPKKHTDIGIRLERVPAVRDRGADFKIPNMGAEPLNTIDGIDGRRPDGQVL